MKRLVVLACAVASLGLLAGPALAAGTKDGKERARTLVVDVLVMNADVMVVDANPANPEGEAGDYVVGTAAVFRRGTRDRIGTASFTSLFVGDGFELFDAALRIRGDDIFVKEHLTPNEANAAVIRGAIVGGTGRFKGARGVARERSLGEGDDTTMTSFLIRVRLRFTTL
ncbi:MAG TPA: hypothetical protein VN213_19760 [Solirubrobacteraceae bacterium]|nr:hypothetical protein [Solirubrobacteraceae bacterium]